MTGGRVRKAAGIWIWGWPLLVLFAPLGVLWLVLWGCLLWVRILEDRTARRIVAADAAAAAAKRSFIPAEIQANSVWFQQDTRDWNAINNAALFRARLQHAQETGLDENGRPL